MGCTRAGHAGLVGMVALVGIMAIAGCSGLFHSSAPVTQVYILRATVHPQAQLTAHESASIRVTRPLASPGLDTDHLILMQSDRRMNYYIGSRWPTNLPQMIEEMTVDTLSSSGQWAAVQDSASAFPSDYLLQMVVRRFEADYTERDAAPEVHVVLDCTVGKRAGREIVASFIAEGSATAGANRLSEVVAAFEDASNKALAAVSEHSALAVQDSLAHPGLAHPAPADPKSTQKVETPVPSITR
jgi:cholesterol transport system auxiliary component